MFSMASLNGFDTSPIPSTQCSVFGHLRWNPLPLISLTNWTTHHLNTHTYINQHTTSTTTTNCLRMQAISSEYTWYWPFRVKFPYCRSILPTRSHTSPTCIYISDNTLPLPSPPVVCMCRQYQASTPGISCFGWNPPPADQSHQLGHTPAQHAYQSQLTHSLHPHHQLFACAGNIKQYAWYQPFRVESPSRWSILPTGPHTSPKCISISANTLPPPPMPVVCMHRQYQVSTPFRVKSPSCQSILPTRPHISPMCISILVNTLPPPPPPVVCMCG